MWQRFTERARKTVFYSQEEAQKFGQGYVSTEHVLLGLLREPDNTACRIIEILGISLNRIRAEVEKQLPRGDARPSQEMTLTPRAKRVIDLAYEEARLLHNNYIGTEHLFFGLIREGEGLAARVFQKVGITLEDARRARVQIQEERPAEPADKATGQTFVPSDKVQWKMPSADAFLSFLMGHCLPQHLMLCFIADEAGLCGRVVRAQCENIGKLQWAMWSQIYADSKNGLRAPDPMMLSLILKNAHTEANGEPIESHHILLALLGGEESAFAKSVNEAGITLERSRELVRELEDKAEG